MPSLKPTKIHVWKYIKAKGQLRGKTKGKWQQRKPQSIVYILCQDSLLEVFDHVLQLSPDSGWISWSFVSREALFRWLWSNLTSAFALRATLLALLFEVYQICLRCVHVYSTERFTLLGVKGRCWNRDGKFLPPLCPLRCTDI